MPPTATTYDLDIGLIRPAPWMPADDAEAHGRGRHTTPGAGRLGPRLRKLLPLRYSEAEQLAAPSRPCTRLVKDVLRVGRWKVGVNPDGSPRWWIVTPDMLRQIEDGFAAARRAGNEFNLCWGHGHPQTKVVDSRDAIAPLDQLFREGNTLWAAAYVDLATAAELRKATRKVSVRVVERWMDGSGRVYPLALLHVAIVDLPVMTGQGPFLDLEKISPQKGKRNMDFQVMLDLWTRALAALGLKMPDHVIEETLPVVVDALLGSVESGDSAGDRDEEAADPTPAPDTAPLEALTPAAGANMPAELGHLLTGIAHQIKDLSHRLDALQTDGARTAFTGRLETLAKSGRINARAVTSLTQTGASHAWDLSLLAPFEDLQMVDLTRRGKSLATGKPPSVKGVIEADLSEEEIKAGTEWLKTGKVGRVS